MENKSNETTNNLNSAPSSERLHIGFFGKRNSGKSSLINLLAGQDVSIVSDVAGTTTDAVRKSVELSPLGPCVLIDTAGFDDDNQLLGELRLEKTQKAAEQVDVAVIVFDGSELLSAPPEIETVQGAGTVLNEAKAYDTLFAAEFEWLEKFKKRGVPALTIINKCDVLEAAGEDAANRLQDAVVAQTASAPLRTSASQGGKNSQGGKDSRSTTARDVIDAIARLMPENYGHATITGRLANAGDSVLLVMPQDIQAPKGRLILPQVQTIRELLDKKCIITCTGADNFADTLATLKRPPDLIITDSQVFKTVDEQRPAESMLTSFSVLFAAYKGDIKYYVEGAKAIDSLTPQSRVLIAECCAHAPLEEDIGRVKIPRLLRKRVGESLGIDIVAGTDFPQDLSSYDLIIQCGGCMFNRAYIMSRINAARAQAIPMCNYGVAIAHLTGILGRVSIP